MKRYTNFALKPVAAESGYQQQQELLALLKIRATGQQQIEQGDTEPAEAFFNRLKQQIDSGER